MRGRNRVWKCISCASWAFVQFARACQFQATGEGNFLESNGSLLAFILGVRLSGVNGEESVRL